MKKNQHKKYYQSSKTPIRGYFLSCYICSGIIEEGDGFFYTVNLKIETGNELYLNEHYYTLCPSCLRKTKNIIKKIEKMPLIKVPLFINDSNDLIAHAAKERLKKAHRWTLKNS